MSHAREKVAREKGVTGGWGCRVNFSQHGIWDAFSGSVFEPEPVGEGDYTAEIEKDRAGAPGNKKKVKLCERRCAQDGRATRNSFRNI